VLPFNPTTTLESGAGPAVVDDALRGIPLATLQQLGSHVDMDTLTTETPEEKKSVIKALRTFACFSTLPPSRRVVVLNTDGVLCFM
jgi:hypothetical protein